MDLSFTSSLQESKHKFLRDGERHHGVWDFHQLGEALEAAGFISVVRMSAATTSVKDAPALLDIHPNGGPRKSRSSMYVEARKPR